MVLLPGLVCTASSEGFITGVKKGRLFERSEFLPFSVVKGVSRRKKSVLNFSLFLSFVSREKERTFFLIIRKLTFQKDG